MQASNDNNKPSADSADEAGGSAAPKPTDKPASTETSPRNRKHAFAPIEPSGQPTEASTEQGGLKLLFAASLLQKDGSFEEVVNQTRLTHVQEPTDLDVLCGRGGLINQHKGNIVYRKIVEYNKGVYRQVPKRYRILVPQSIVHTIYQAGGRFLQASDNEWMEISLARATQKTSQALREKSKSDKTDGDDEDGDEECVGEDDDDEEEEKNGESECDDNGKPYKTSADDGDQEGEPNHTNVHCL
jgi:DNA-directed RNA polymerase delta subunit